MSPLDKLTIVVVTHNSETFITACLDHLKRLGQLSRTVVVDNHSRDRTPSLLEAYRGEARIVRNDRNTGYGAGCNRGAAERPAEYVLFMNPDAFPAEGVIERLVAYLDAHPRAGAASCRLLDPDGGVQPSCRHFLRPSIVVWRLLAVFLPLAQRRIGRVYLMSDEDRGRDHCVPWLTGAFLMLRRAAFERARGFDERYFLYCEDTDLCLRLAKDGWTVDFVPSTGDTSHTHQHQSRRPRLSRLPFVHLGSVLRFIWTHRAYLKAVAAAPDGTAAASQGGDSAAPGGGAGRAPSVPDRTGTLR